MNNALSGRTLELIRLVRGIITEIEIGTLRQIHYCLVAMALAIYVNDRRSYQRLSRVTTLARRKYRQLQLAGYPEACMPEDTLRDDVIVDELRQPERVNCWDNLNDYLHTVKRAYRRDAWQSQPVHCELWSEKASLLASLRPVTQKYGITLRALRGFGSCGVETQIAHLFAGIDKPIEVFYTGDWDASGELIEQEFYRRVERAAGREFSLRRLAIHPEDIKKFKLPPLAIKDSDSRSAGFKKRHGKNAACTECDALPPQELRRRVEEAIRDVIDWETWSREEQIEDVELASINEFVTYVKNLPQLPGGAP